MYLLYLKKNCQKNGPQNVLPLAIYLMHETVALQLADLCFIEAYTLPRNLVYSELYGLEFKQTSAYFQVL